MNHSRYFLDSFVFLRTGLLALVTLWLFIGDQVKRIEQLLVIEAGFTVVLWLFLTAFFLPIANYLLTRYANRKEVAGVENEPHPDRAETPSMPEPAGHAKTPSPDDALLKFLALRTALIWAYQADPYHGEASPPLWLALPRHLTEKLSSWAEQRELGLNEAVAQMALRGLADDHATWLAAQPHWLDAFDGEEVTDDSLG